MCDTTDEAAEQIHETNEIFMIISDLYTAKDVSVVSYEWKHYR